MMFMSGEPARKAMLAIWSSLSLGHQHGLGMVMASGPLTHQDHAFDDPTGDDQRQ